MLLFVVALAAASPSPGAEGVKDQYRGWSSTALRNGLVKVQVVPQIGGRIIQFSLGDTEFCWVNPSLAGKTPPPSGLGPDKSWLNYGGDKLWPAPQGWDNNQQWPGPPDAVLDGQPYRSQMSKDGQSVAVRLESGKDLRSGIQFARTIRLFDGTTRVALEATMTNIDTKPRRWGIWSHTQLDGATGQGVPNTKMIAYCPINPASHFPKGYSVIFGAADNPSFQRDAQWKTIRVQYQYRVGKIGLDSHAGWVATVDGTKGAVFVQRFVFEPKQEYPDGSSVEFWHNGRGSFRAWGKENVMKDDLNENPCVFESELISPFARLKPGASYTWCYDWFAANIGGDFPIVDCRDSGVIAEPLQVNHVGSGWRLTGRFGVFASGTPQIEWRDTQGRAIKAVSLRREATPLKPLVLDDTLPSPAGAQTAALIAPSGVDRAPRELASMALGGNPRLADQAAWDWYKKQPWLVGTNFLPSTAANTTEFWQAESFDEPTIERELAIAQATGFNTCRVFTQYLVWKHDPEGFRKRFDRFLTIAQKHHISVVPTLFDDCSFGDPPVRQPYLGKQRDPIPGMIAPSWTPSPGLETVTDRKAWPDLQRYVKDTLSSFGKDPRVVFWDLYNEPGNSGMGNKSLPLVEATFAWARQAGPTQPLTMGVWNDGLRELNAVLLAQSDIITYHAYTNYEGQRAAITRYKAYQRPVICTEWMARWLGSRWDTDLPLFKREAVGCYNWGLVNGRMQCQFGWGSKRGSPEPKIWFHDLYHKDGTPYDPKEIESIRKTTHDEAACRTP
jgi:hypothetical protein